MRGAVFIAAMHLSTATGFMLAPGSSARAEPTEAVGAAETTAAHAADSSILATTAPSADEIAAWVSVLVAGPEASREGAFRALVSLEEDALPAIRARLETLSARRPPPAEVQQMLTWFRHGAGSRRADDVVDIAPGVLAIAREGRPGPIALVAEPLLLMRSLERIGTSEAGKLIAEVLALDPRVWAPEAKRVRGRMGAKLLPTFVALQNHSSPDVRSWVRVGIRDLRAEAPGEAVQQGDSTLLADLLRAYGEARQFDAMRVVMSFVGSERAQVREAARWSMAQFGRHAIWRFRESYESFTGNEPDPSWGWERTMQELYRAHDDARLVEVREALNAGLAAKERGDLEGMAASFDAVLRRAPRLDGREVMAVGYALRGAALLAKDDLEGAETAYTRALSLAPQAEAANQWRAELAFIAGERSLTRGIVDLEAYRRAVSFSPQHEAAREAFDRLSGEERRRERRNREWAAGLAAAFLVLFATSRLAKRRKKELPETTMPTSSEATLPDESASTLPG